jgi:hypothetical protein
MTDRMTAVEYQALTKTKPKKRSKYGNVRTEYGGRTYHSKAEAATAALLDNLQRVGKIRGWLPQQPSFPMPGGGKYTADFEIFIECGSYVMVLIHDTKGYDTAESKLKRSYVKERHGINITTSDNDLIESITHVNDFISLLA